MIATDNMFRVFLNEYEQYIESVLRPEHQRVREFFDCWRESDYWASYSRSKGAYPSPIKAIYTRIKRPEKVVDKILQKPRDYSDGISPLSFYKMHDCIGVRIIVYFLSQLPYLDRELRKSPHVEISTRRPPEAYMSRELLNRFGLSHIANQEKESGYSSIHYVVRLKNNHPQSTPGNEPKMPHPWFEVQVRTMSQEMWSEMEHILAYKSEKRTNFSARRRLQILSRTISAMDEQFDLLYEELLQNQETLQYEENDLLNTETLPFALSMLGLRCAQYDFDIILSLLKSRGILTLKEFTALATPKRLETIRNTYSSQIGRPPSNFEIIASLGALLETAESENEEESVESYIEYSKSWNRFRKNFPLTNKNGPRSYEL
ncbi:MAG: hypothetical protein GY765_38480 [bacterium]|nr:hypothetical protein [bacterium]